MSERDDDRRPTAEELLAAYASGGLRGAEAAEVEELVARDPAARAELDAMRTTLAAVRAAEPVPAEEPDWEQMASDIRAACVQPPPGLWQRLRGVFAPLRGRRGQVALGLAVTAAAALVIVLLVGRGREQASEPVQVATTTPADAGAGDPVQPLRAPGEEVRVAEIEELDEPELEALEVAAAQAELTAEELAELEQLATSLAPAEGDLELGMFEDSGYDDWLAGMSESDLDLLEEELADG